MIVPALDAQQAAALELLRSASRVLLVGHSKPDGDCLGSELAMARVLGVLGKQVWIENPDPVEERYDFLAREQEFRTHRGGDLPAHDLAVFLDFCELSRTGAMAGPLARAPSKKLVVDHHIFQGTPWWDAAFVDVKAAATGIVVRRIARALGVALDSVAARGVFTALVTDTGWFKYSNTDAESFAVAAELVAAGCDPSEVYNAVYQRMARSDPRAIGSALQRVEYFADGRLAVVDLPRAARGEPDLLDSDQVLDLLRAVGKVEVVLLVREQADGTCKLSARSKTQFNVQQLARRFGGGGHAKAAGATFPGPLADARERLVTAALADLGGVPDPRP